MTSADSEQHMCVSHTLCAGSGMDLWAFKHCYMGQYLSIIAFYLFWIKHIH